MKKLQELEDFLAEHTYAIDDRVHEERDGGLRKMIRASTEPLHRVIDMLADINRMSEEEDV